MVCLCVCLEIAQKSAAERVRFLTTKVYLSMQVCLSVCLSILSSVCLNACDLVLSLYLNCVCLFLCWNVFSLVPRHVFDSRGDDVLSTEKCVWELHNATDNTNFPTRHVCRNVCARGFVCVSCNFGRMAPNKWNPSFMRAFPQFVTLNQDIRKGKGG